VTGRNARPPGTAVVFESSVPHIDHKAISVCGVAGKQVTRIGRPPGTAVVLESSVTHIDIIVRYPSF